MNWPTAAVACGLLVACPFCGPLAPAVALGGVATLMRASIADGADAE